MSNAKISYSDKEFIAGLKTGDAEVLGAFYKKHFPAVLKHISSNRGDLHEAKDVYQDTIIIVLENVKKENFELTCAFQTYIYAIAKRLWLKHLQKNGKTFLLKENAEEKLPDLTDEFSNNDAHELNLNHLAISIKQLGEPCQTLISDFYVNKLSMEEIAEKFGYTNADNAKNQKYKCLQRLKKYFFNTKNKEE
ncbi:MAG: sigma-70 family RNA polymerase sigma factor [Bacteroidetes bacterium]|nr:sigma-70 family RNA polymerase sigma factor [Bacteroidota bacterium]